MMHHSIKGWINPLATQILPGLFEWVSLRTFFHSIPAA
jgi:hypothetical protein